MAKRTNAGQREEAAVEQVFVTFTDDVVISDGEKELVITLNIEFTFDVPLDGQYSDDDLVLINKIAEYDKLP